MSLRSSVFSPFKRLKLARSQSGPAIMPIQKLKPASPFHYTGEPGVEDEIDKLRRLEIDIRSRMLAANFLDRFNASQSDVFKSLGVDETQIQEIPRCKWHSAFDIGMRLTCPVNEEQRLRIVAELDKLHGLLGTAALFDRMRETTELGLTEEIANALAPFVAGRMDQQTQAQQIGEREPLASVDGYGRIAARGRAKSARATVWIIKVKRMPPTTPKLPVEAVREEEVDSFVERVEQEAQTAEEAPSRDVPEPLRMYGLSAEPTIGRVLVNNRPMVDALPEIHSRNIVLEPFALTQTLGDYNVFAIATQGGRTSRSRAIANAIAKCLFEVEGATARQVLTNSGLLVADPRLRLRSMPNRKGNRAPRRVAGKPGRAKRSKR